VSDDRGLLDYNKRGALANCLAIEDHLASLPPGINNSWCVKKHAMLVCGHHLAEAVNHASRISRDLGARYMELKRQAEKTLRPGLSDPLPSLGEVAAFRNDMRRVLEDPTLVESCALCKKDGGLGGLQGTGHSDSLPGILLATAFAVVAGSPRSKWKTPALAGISVLGVAKVLQYLE